MSSSFAYVALLNVWTIVAGELDRDHGYSLLAQESDVLNLLQLKGSKATQDSAIACKEEGLEPMGEGGYLQMEQRLARASDLVKTRKLSFLPAAVLNLHKKLIIDIEKKGVDGSFVETGVAKGGSALIISSMKNQERCFHLYDTFEGIPKPSELDGADVWARYKEIQSGMAGSDYYGYMDNLESFVQQQFVDASQPPANSGVVFHKGRFQDTFHPKGLLAYVHLDGDWYESTHVVLERALPLLATNGIMILDDAYQWSGAGNAVRDVFATNLSNSPHLHSRLNVTKDGKKFQIVSDIRLYIKRVE